MHLTAPNPKIGSRRRFFSPFSWPCSRACLFIKPWFSLLLASFLNLRRTLYSPCMPPLEALSGLLFGTPPRTLALLRGLALSATSLDPLWWLSISPRTTWWALFRTYNFPRSNPCKSRKRILTASSLSITWPVLMDWFQDYRQEPDLRNCSGMARFDKIG